MAAYDHYSTLLDSSISKVPTVFARAKSLQIEIQFRSIKTLFCHSVSTLLTSCPNLDEMRKRCKIKWTVEMWDWFCSQLVAGIKEMHMHGMISEEWFDANQFPMDTTVEEVEVPKVFTLKQLHLQRHVIFGHQSMKNYYNDCHATHVRKNRSALQQRYKVSKNLLQRNQEAQTSLIWDATKIGGQC